MSAQTRPVERHDRDPRCVRALRGARATVGPLLTTPDGYSLGGAERRCQLGEGLGEPVGILPASLRIANLRLAGRWRPLAEPHSVRLLRQEGDVEGRVLHDVGETFNIRWNGWIERNREVERQGTILVLEPIIARVLDLDVLAVHSQIGEVAKLLETFDVDLGELGKFFARVDAVVVLVEALDGHRRVELIERPLVVQAGEGPTS